MADANVAQRPALLVAQRLVDLGERVLALDDAAERRVLAVEVVEAVLEREEELTAAPARVAVAGDGHAERAERRVLELGRHVGDKVGRRLVGGRRAREEVEDGRAAAARVGRVAGLGDKVLDDVVEGAEVELEGLAQLEEVEREDRALLRLEVDLEEGLEVSSAGKVVG